MFSNSWWAFIFQIVNPKPLPDGSANYLYSNTIQAKKKKKQWSRIIKIKLDTSTFTALRILFGLLFNLFLIFFYFLNIANWHPLSLPYHMITVYQVGKVRATGFCETIAALPFNPFKLDVSRQLNSGKL